MWLPSANFQKAIGFFCSDTASFGLFRHSKRNSFLFRRVVHVDKVSGVDEYQTDYATFGVCIKYLRSPFSVRFFGIITILELG